MNPISICIAFLGFLQISTKSRLAAATSVLLICSLITIGQGTMIAGLNIPLYRLALIIATVRIIAKGEHSQRENSPTDKLAIALAIWFIFSSLFHEYREGSGPVYMISFTIDSILSFFVFRNLCTTTNYDTFIRNFAYLMIPISIGMIIEKTIHFNAFSLFGGVPETPLIRDGSYRAQGPFPHPILAGTIGASTLPLIISIYQNNKTLVKTASIACISIVITSASSGPILALISAIGILSTWKYRRAYKHFLPVLIVTYILIEIASNRPAYYVISNIDLTGSSTGWHRSFLIEQTIKHFNEWWLFGTDYTRHWMPNQGFISKYHTDITSYYIMIAVHSGLTGLILLIAIISKTISKCHRLTISENSSFETKLRTCCIIASITSHLATSISVSYFGQAQTYFWLPIAIAVSVTTSSKSNEPDANF